MDLDRLTLREGMHRARLHPLDVWLAYVSLGGNGDLAAVEGCIDGTRCPDDREHNLIAQALNEALLDQGDDFPVGYRGVFEISPDR